MKEKKSFKGLILALIMACVSIAITIVVLSSAGAARYYITIEKTEHGTVTADRKRAKANEKVKLTCTPDEGYELKEISVNGKLLEELTFVMPKENVLVEAKFAVENNSKDSDETNKGDTPGSIVYEAVYPTGKTYTVSWNFIYEKDGLVATAWVEGENSNGNGVLLNLSREELGKKAGLKYLPNYTYQIFCEYQKKNDVISPKLSMKCADSDGSLQDKTVDGITAEMMDWEVDGKIVGYQAKLIVKYSALGYSNQKDAMSSLVLLAGNRAQVLTNTMADFWMDGEYDAENYLSYPRLVDDNTLQKNKFIDMTEMEKEAYRDTGAVLDGEISKGEYKGTKLEDATDNHRITVQSHLTKGKNIQLVMEIESNTSFEKIVNAYPGVGQYLFAEMGFGNNDGQTCTMVKVNVKGEVENAIAVVKASNNGKQSDFKYKAVVEMWIPKTSISNNSKANSVRFSRLALFSGNMGEGSKADNIFLVAKWANINNCDITANGIKLESEIVPPESEIQGMDGVLKDGEYKGAIIQSESKQHRASVQGYLTKGKNIRLVVKVQANTAPDKIINDYPSVGKYLFVEAGFGNNTGENDCTLVKVNVLGKAAYAAAVAKTTDNGKSAQYRYTTIIEMWVPQSSITNNTTPENVQISRLALFANNVEGNSTPDNLFLVAKWAGINDCSITTEGIHLKVQVPEEDTDTEVKVEVPDNESEGLDGVISNGEYKGAILKDKGEQRQITVRGHLTSAKNIRLAMTIDTQKAPDEVLNNYPGLSQYLFAELGFGDNTGDGDCTLVKANLLGQAENAATVVITKDNGADAEYRYTTVVEMWVPTKSITNNTVPDNVPITRLALFSDNFGEGSTPKNTFLVAKWAGVNECSVTENGIRLASQMDAPESEANGLDGVISENEYKGAAIEGSSKNYKISVKGYLNEQKNIRMGVVIESNQAPENSLNNYPGLSQYLFAEFGFGANTGNNDCTLVKANVLGDAENAATTVKTTLNSEDVEYRYTTVIEMWIPQSSITNNNNPDKVPMTRMALFHGLDQEDSETNWIVAKWAGINDCNITSEGIVLKEKVNVPEAEAVGLDGEISEGEYKGIMLDSTKGSSASIDYKMTVQGYLTQENNIRLGVTVYSTRNPETMVNPVGLWSRYLFAEFGFGNNNGEVCKKIYADVFGEVENAATMVKTTQIENASYQYKTVIEMWIPKENIDQNPTPNMVQFTRAALFHQSYANPENVNETWLVLRSAWNNAGMNNCYVTKEGIVETHLLAGMDGVISEGEYGGKVLDSNHTNQANYKLAMYGFLQGTEMNKHSIRLAIRLDAKTAPEASVNPTTMFSDKLYVDLAFGDVDGSGERREVYADVVGKAANAVTVVNTTDNGEGTDYRYTTIIEMWIPQSGISVESHGELVWIPRLGIFHQNVENDAETWVVAKWAGLHTWLRVENAGLNY